MSLFATIIDIVMCVVAVLIVIGFAACLVGIGYILYKEIRDKRDDDDV